MDYRASLLFIIFSILQTAFSSSFCFLILPFILFALYAYFSRISILVILKRLMLFIPFFLIIVLINELASESAIYFSVFLILRLILILLFAISYAQISCEDEIQRAMEHYLAPLEKAGIRVRGLLSVISLSFFFIPRIKREAECTYLAQKGRGRKEKNKVAVIMSLIIPVTVSSFKRAEILSQALLLKGYEGRKAARDKSRMDVKSRIIVMISFINLLITVFWRFL